MATDDFTRPHPWPSLRQRIYLNALLGHQLSRRAAIEDMPVEMDTFNKELLRLRHSLGFSSRANLLVWYVLYAGAPGAARLWANDLFPRFARLQNVTLGWAGIPPEGYLQFYAQYYGRIRKTLRRELGVSERTFFRNLEQIADIIGVTPPNRILWMRFLYLVYAHIQSHPGLLL